MASRKKKPSKGDRDASGRFKPGNPGGPGNPHLRQIAAYRRAAQNAITAKDIEDVLENLREIALGSRTRKTVVGELVVELPPAFTDQIAAAKVLFERVVGKVRDPEIAIDFPEVRTAADLPAASAAILQAAREGHISTTDLVALNTALAAMRQHLGDAEFFRRLEEAQAALDEGQG